MRQFAHCLGFVRNNICVAANARRDAGATRGEFMRNKTVFGIKRFGDRVIAMGLFAVLVSPFVLARI